MSVQQTITYQDVIEMVESLPETQQESLIEVLQRRLAERRKEILADNIKKARDEFSRGEIRKGTVKDLMDELSEK